LTAFRVMSRLAFLAIMTPNLSKSERPARALTAARRFAHDEASHLAWTPDFSKYFRTVPVPAPRGRAETERGVRVRYRYANGWRGTPVRGPSIIARLWSMISTITAILPSEGPLLMRTTRPTSTKRLKVDGSAYNTKCTE